MKYTRFFLMTLVLMLCVTTLVFAGGDSPYNIQVVRQDAVLLDEEGLPIGTAEYWNTRKNFHVELFLDGDWHVGDTQLYAGEGEPNVDPYAKKGKPVPGKFPCKRDFNPEHSNTMIQCSLKDELEHSWGGNQTRYVALHGDLSILEAGGDEEDSDSDSDSGSTNSFWMIPATSSVEGELITGAYDGTWENSTYGGWFPTKFYHPIRGQFIDAPVKGLNYETPTHVGSTESTEENGSGGFDFFPGETIGFSIADVPIGSAAAVKKVSPLDLFPDSDASLKYDDDGVQLTNPAVNLARVLQTLDCRENQGTGGAIEIESGTADCFSGLVEPSADGNKEVDFSSDDQIEALVASAAADCGCADGTELTAVTAAEAAADLATGISESGIFRKNVTKTEDWGETKQKLDVMPVYFPGLRSDGTPSVCCMDETDDGVDDCDPKLCDDPDTAEIELCAGDPGVPYKEWRLGGDPAAEECDPRDDTDGNQIPDGDDGNCVVTLIECRELAKPILATYMEKIDIYDDQVNTEFWPGRFSWDIYTAVSRDDGTTWKRMNVSRMADMSSFELETGEPFHGTTGSPYMKVNDNKILVAWQSKFCKSGNPRYSINLCDDPETDEVEADDPLTEENECAVYCTGNPENDTEVCEPDYPGDDAYFVTDIWGVRGQQRSVDYDEVDDVADLGIGEIPYSCLWAARGVIVTQKDLDEGTFASLNVEDDPETPDIDETDGVVLGDIVWFKPERITSGRRDAYFVMMGSARGAGFAIAWQEDPNGLRPGKGKGPGEGWSGAITNHKSDIWYTHISYDEFNIVDEDFEPGGPGGGTDADPDGEGYLDKPGLGRPKALVPFALPVRVSDNDMVNTHTLKVEPSTDCPTFPDSTGENDPVCFPEVEDGSFVPIDAEEIAAEFCGHPDADPATCCDPDNHEGDPNCEDLKGLFGNATGTKRYAYLARSIDEIDNATGLYVAGGDGVPDYQYYVDSGGTLDLCDLSGENSFFDVMPGSSEHERWFGFTNSADADKLVCVASDGRLLDGDVFASRPMIQLQPYMKPDGTKSAWALLAYEESKGMGHSLAAAEHEEEDVNIIGLSTDDDSGQDKPIKQDLGKNMLYHSFDFAQPDLVNPGHIVNLPALCGGKYPTWCDDPKTLDYDETQDHLNNPTCTCEAGQPVPLYFDYWVEGTDPETDPGEWLPDDTKFLQYRTEIARRARFLMQSPGKMGESKTLGAIIFKQGQEGQGRPADAYIRRFVKSGTGNPYKFENIECTKYLDETFDLPSCPTDGVAGYNCNVWGEAYGDRLCGGTIEATASDGTEYTRRDHINLTSADVDLAVGVGPEDDTPDDPTDDVYSRNKVLLWSQHERNLGDESYGLVHEDGTDCDVLGEEGEPEACPGMYSNVRSHRGFIRGDFFTVAYALSPNWAAARNGNDRYNFYTRRSFDGGKTWTTNPEGEGVYVCPEFRTDPNLPDPDPDGSGNLPPEAYDETCGTYVVPDPVPDDYLPPAPVGIAMTNYLDLMVTTPDGLSAQFIGAGEFEPARNVSEIKSNKHTSADPRMGTTPPTYPLDGTAVDEYGELVNLRFVEDEYVNNMFFVAWGTADNSKSTGGDSLKTEASPLDVYYTRTEDYGDNFVKFPWVIGGETSNQAGETVWRYGAVAAGEPEEQGECQLRATSDGSKAYVIWHSLIAAEEDPDEIPTRYYPWKPSESSENDIWFRRLIFWPVVEEETTPITP